MFSIIYNQCAVSPPIIPCELFHSIACVLVAAGHLENVPFGALASHMK